MGHSKYRILGLVGQGQFGRVYCASVRRIPGKDPGSTTKLVALKELSHQRAPTSEFLRELWFLITLQHPNIVTCRALEHTATGRYLVMDYCEGGTLRALMEQERPLRLMEGLELILGVLGGLEYAHDRGVIHCDIKPENILLTLNSTSWLPRLSDFGIARRLPEIGSTLQKQEISPAATVGSPAYMAPERFYGLFSPMSDIYAVGVLLYEMLIGDRPFHGNPGDLMWAHLNQRFEMPDILPDSLKEIIKKSLEKLPARRFANAATMAQALRVAMEDEKVKEMRDGVIPLGTLDSIVVPPQSKVTANQPPTTYYLPTPGLIASTNIPPKPLLAGADTYLYSGIGRKLSVWCQRGQDPLLGETPTVIGLPHSVRSLIPVEGGCYILTHKNIYWLNSELSKVGKPLWNVDLDGKTEDLELTTQEIQASTPPLAHYLYKATATPDNRWLAIGLAGELRFYTVSRKGNTSEGQILSLSRTIPLPTKRLPELIPLDGGHLLTVWHIHKDPKESPQTVFRVYTRRGNLVGTLRVGVKLSLLQRTSQPYTLLGIANGNPASLLVIKLRPLQVKRIPLEIVPVCACVATWGYILADAVGDIMILDNDGNDIGHIRGPVTPRAIASWGTSGIAIVTHSGEHSHLHFLQINIENSSINKIQ